MPSFGFALGFWLGSGGMIDPHPDDALLLSGDMQSGQDYLLLSGDAQSGSDIILLSGEH